MARPGRDWKDRSRMKPAAEVKIIYGHGLAQAESSRWPRYLAVSTPTAYQTARPYLSTEPAAVAHAAWLDFDYLKEMTDNLPNDAELVVGVGGGRALDAAKYVALWKDLPLVLVPTAISTGSIIHGVVARFKGHSTAGDANDWPWVDSEHVLVDYDLVLASPYYLNTAGVGDVIFSYDGLAEWKRRARLGIGPAYDEAVGETIMREHEQMAQSFEKSLDAAGHLTPESVRVIMAAVQDRDARAVRFPQVSGGEHPFVTAMETANGRNWAHGELVALGAVIITWLCDERPEVLTGWLDRCQVRRRPSQIGISREELRKGLEFAPAFMGDIAAGRDVKSVLRDEPVVGPKFDAAWEFLEKA